MRTAHLAWHSYRYLPYEIELAHKEVQAVLGVVPRETNGGLLAELNGHPIDLTRRLTYIRAATLDDGEAMVTDQARLENSANRDSMLMPEYGPRRQSTRYSAHGLHEYRGKFNPQVVRAIGNLVGLHEEAWLLDPFCGSGTTLLESAHSSWNCVGLDMNPLAVLISNAKIEAVTIPVETLYSRVQATVDSLSKTFRSVEYTAGWSETLMTDVAGSAWRGLLPNYNYLTHWFPLPVLAQFSAVLGVVQTERAIGNILRVVLSDLVRKASYQDPGDLRIRRRKDAAPNYPLIPWFLDSLREKLDVVARARSVSDVRGIQRAFVADSRLDLREILASEIQDARFDAAITSPPYVTALPYADTQRLSLALLGLIDSTKVMALDRSLVGTRELGRSARIAAEAALEQDSSLHPEVRQLCMEMLVAVTSSRSDGFRRRNMPALVHQYFSDIGKVLARVADVVKTGGRFALVIGRNTTVLGNKEFVIDTPRLVSLTSEQVGWRLELSLELDTYQRFDIHQRNSIRQESLVILRRLG